MSRRQAAGLAAALAALLAMPASAGADLRFERCGGYGYSCARLSVPLDHSGSVAGTVSLRVQRVRSRARRSRAPVFVLAGGPGQSATAVFSGDGLGALYPAYRNRDLIVVDQRGTGRSGALSCPALERADPLGAGRAAGACAARLGARRGFFTTADMVEDIEAIRRELGSPRIALLGTSYGTKVALAYALRYPAGVERLVLDSVVEAAGPDALYRDSFAAVPRILRSLCGSRCRSFTRDPVADLRRLVARLQARRLRGPLVDRRGRRREVSMSRGELFAVLVAGDVAPELRAAFPGSVRAALTGDPAPLLRLRRRVLATGVGLTPRRILSAGLYAATTCEETAFPWARSAPPVPSERLRQATANSSGLADSEFAPFDRATALGNDLIRLCERWPTARPAPVFGPGPLPDVPVLLLEGEDDVRTPLENARRVGVLFPRASLVVVPATGHSALGADRSGCARRAFGRFFAGRAVPTRCRRVRRQSAVDPPPPRGLSRVGQALRVRGLRGRTLAAVSLTLGDAAEDLAAGLGLTGGDSDLARGGGLRGGSYSLGPGGTLRLSGFRFVPGVRVGGSIRRFGGVGQRGTLRIRGDAASPGKLAIRGRRISGTLGGRRVRGSLTAPVRAATPAARAALRPPSAW